MNIRDSGSGESLFLDTHTASIGLTAWPLKSVFTART